MPHTYVLFVLLLCRMRQGRDEGAREIPRWRRAAACCASVCPCFHLRLAWHDPENTHTPLAQRGIVCFFFGLGVGSFPGARPAARLRGASPPLIDLSPCPFGWRGMACMGFEKRRGRSPMGSGEGVGCWCGVSLLGYVDGDTVHSIAHCCVCIHT